MNKVTKTNEKIYILKRYMIFQCKPSLNVLIQQLDNVRKLLQGHSDVMHCCTSTVHKIDTKALISNTVRPTLSSLTLSEVPA